MTALRMSRLLQKAQTVDALRDEIADARAALDE